MPTRLAYFARMTDEEGVRAARAGDSAAFGRLVDRHLPGVLAIARACARRREDALDVAQLVLLRAWQSLGQLQDPARFAPWLHAITRNTARNWLRDHPARERPLDGVDLEPVDPHSVTSADRGVDEAPIRAAVDALPGDLAEVVRLRFQGDLSYDEIARSLDIPLSQVRDRLYRAKLALRKVLRP